ncbi:MAG: RidA family protein [Deltaproteobacteria bacterium]|nr:RidA family protein [Deltaproteobacteria bacterium]
MTEKTPEQRLEALGVTLPPPPKPLASYIPWVMTGNLLFVSGQLPLVDGKVLHPGLVGETVTAEQAAVCARLAATNALSVAREALGSLDRIRRVVRLAGHVAAPSTFTGHPQVVNGASDFLAEVFGERGRHARVALGAPSLPANACVELEILFEAE